MSSSTHRENEDPLKFAEWPSFVWSRCFTLNMPLPREIVISDNSTIVYLVQKCLRIEDNIALMTAMWLSRKLNVPMMALVLVEESTVSNTMENVGKTGLSLNAQSLARRNATRLALLSYLKQQLSQYEIPLVGIRCNILNGDSSTSRKQCLLDLFGANGVSNDRIFALFTDDFYHPLHFHICSEISKIRNIPILAFDSNQVVVNNGMENCNHFDDFCLKYTACVEAMASLEWESEFTFERDEMLRVQRRLQFCRMGNSFLPSVLRFDDRERHFIDWDAIDRGLMLHVKDWPLNSITVEGHQRIRESVSVSNSASLTRETLDIMTVSSTFGLLSPLLWCKAYLANRQELQSVCNTFVYHEFAILSFVKEIHKIIVVKPTSGVIQVDWFATFNDHVHSLLADSSGMLAMFQQKMRSVYGLVTPKDFRLCKSPIKSFNIVQKKLFDTKFHFNLSCIELQCWVLGYIGFLPTVNMALELSFRELLVHFPIGLEDSPLPAALFIRIIEDIMEPIRNIDDASQAMAVFTKRYEELQNEVELSQGT